MQRRAAQAITTTRSIWRSFLGRVQDIHQSLCPVSPPHRGVMKRTRAARRSQRSPMERPAFGVAPVEVAEQTVDPLPYPC